MSYAIKDDIASIYTQNLVDLLSEQDELEGPDVDFDAAFLQASDEMDSYIGVKYTLPLTNTPSNLKRTCVDVAVYILSPSASAMTEEIENRYKAAISWLKNISSGKAIIIGAQKISDVNTGGANGDGGVLFESDDALFSSQNMREI